jgi:hypothetical protein
VWGKEEEVVWSSLEPEVEDAPGHIVRRLASFCFFVFSEMALHLMAGVAIAFVHTKA